MDDRSACAENTTPARTLLELGNIPLAKLPVKGEDTDTGGAGYCPRCKEVMDAGPDRCLGLLSGVSHACCGHGIDRRAYVVLGGEPDQDATTISHPEVLRGKAALAYFGMEASSAMVFHGALVHLIDTGRAELALVHLLDQLEHPGLFSAYV